MPDKPYSESCEQNREPILSVIKPILAAKSHVLEIGSGTGQHAVYFAREMPHLRWQCSDRVCALEGIRLWLNEAALANLPPPLALDVTDERWPPLSSQRPLDAIFTANSVHIMNHYELLQLLRGAGRLLPPGGDLLIYGPFNYHGGFSSDSNARFDHWLKSRDPHSGIKDFEMVNTLAQANRLQLSVDYAMPANNRILHFIRQS